MKITDDIILALRLAIEKSGTQKLFTKKCGVSQELLSMYLNRKVRNISLETWLKLKPHLETNLKYIEEIEICSKTEPAQTQIKNMTRMVEECELFVRRVGIDINDKTIHLLLGYWKNMKDPQKFDILKKLAEIYERDAITKKTILPSADQMRDEDYFKFVIDMEIDFRDKTMESLLEYWRSLPMPQRFEVLQALAKNQDTLKP